MGNENTALKFRVVFFEISEKVRIKERFILNTHLPYTLRFFDQIQEEGLYFYV